MSRYVLVALALWALTSIQSASAAPQTPAAPQPAPAAPSPPIPAAPAPPSPAAIIFEIPGESVQLLDPSIDAAGMGGASSAAFWQEDPNDYQNPALAGFHHGLRYSFGQTQLFKGVIDDAEYRTHRVLAGAWGIGVVMSGKPDHVGRLRLSYPELAVADTVTLSSEPFSPHQDVRRIAVGVNVIDLASSIIELMGGAPLTIQPRVSLAVGHAWKEVAIDMAPSGFLGGHLVGKGENRDAGAVLRIAPVDQIGRDLNAPRKHAQYRLDLAGAYSRLNYDKDARIVYIDGHGEQMPDIRQYGGTARLTMAFAPNDGTVWYRDWAAPAVFMALAWDHADLQGSDLDTPDDEFPRSGTATRIGSELSIFDVFFLRLGHVTDHMRNVQGTTYGAGLSLKYRNAIGVRGDWAHYPVQDILDQEWNRYGFSVFIDPFRFKQED